MTRRFDKGASRAVQRAAQVVVSLTGSPGSVAAAVWTIQQGRTDALAIFDPIECRPPVSASYVREVAGLLGLRLITYGDIRSKDRTVIVVGATFGQITEVRDGIVLVRPLSGWTEEDVLSDLDEIGIRPHPATVLGLSDVCSAKELEEAALATSGASLEDGIAAGAVITGVYPPGMISYATGEKRVRRARPIEEPVAGPAPRGTVRDLWLPDPGKHWLFSYGSNGPKQLSDRLGHPVASIPATAPGWGIAFVGHSARWGSATATIVPDKMALMGSATQVSDADLAKLDRHEGVPRTYERRRITIEVGRVAGRQGRTVDAFAYVATSKKVGKPSEAYLDAMDKHRHAVWGKEGEGPRSPAPEPSTKARDAEAKARHDAGWQKKGWRFVSDRLPLGPTDLRLGDVVTYKHGNTTRKGLVMEAPFVVKDRERVLISGRSTQSDKDRQEEVIFETFEKFIDVKDIVETKRPPRSQKPSYEPP